MHGADQSSKQIAITVQELTGNLLQREVRKQASNGRNINVLEFAGTDGNVTTPDYGSEGCRFKSGRAHQKIKHLAFPPPLPPIQVAVGLRISP